MEGFGLKSYNKLIDSIEKSKQCKLENFIYALGIPNVGLQTAKDICKYFNNPNLFDTSRSSMEILIEQLLAEVIGRENFHREYTWEWLLSETGNHLYVDFYIPNINIVIEYDGRQHYKLDCFNMSLLDLMNLKYNDNKKTQYCKDNNIKLIRIPYWDFNKIEEILVNELKVK